MLNIAPYEPLRAKDGLIIVAVANPGLWGRFCEAIDRPDLRDDPRFKTNTLRVANREALKQAIEAVFQGLTVQELTERFQAKQVPCGRVRSISEAMAHPQVAARDVLVVQQHPQVGTIETLAPAEFDKWKSLLQTVTDDWVKKLEQKGYDARKLLDDLQGMIKQASS